MGYDSEKDLCFGVHFNCASVNINFASAVRFYHNFMGLSALQPALSWSVLLFGFMQSSFLELNQYFCGNFTKAALYKQAGSNFETMKWNLTLKS